MWNTALPSTSELTNWFWHLKPYDAGQGREKTEEGILEPVWSCGPILLPSLIDLLEKTADEVEDEEVDQDIDYKELLNDDH